jgi:uncharacterized protein involved in exopolysaccharide biosynthesis
MAEKSTKKTVRDLLRIVFRRRWVFLVGAALFAVVTLIGAHSLPRKYTGTTKFERRTDAAVAGTETGTAASASFSTFKLTLRHDLTGYNAVRQIAEELGLTEGLPHDLEGHLTPAGARAKMMLVNQLRRRVRVRWMVGSAKVDLIAISMTDSDPELARRVPDALVKNYINNVSERIKERLTSSRDFLDKQLRESERRLSEINRRRIRFETDNRGKMFSSPGELQDRIQQIVTDLHTLRRQKKEVEQTMVRLIALRRKATSRPTSQPVQIVRGPNPQLRRLQEQLRSWNEALDSMLMQMKPAHPKVKAAMAKIAQLEKRIAETPKEVVIEKVFEPEGTDEKDLEGFAVNMEAAKAKWDTVKDEIERQQNRLDDLNALLKNFIPMYEEYKEILASQEKEKAEADRWRKRLTDIQMALAAEAAKRRTHLETIEAAQRQFRPSSPDLKMVLGFALLGGVGFGGALVFLLNLLDRTIATAEDASKYFEVPVHGIIGEIVTRRDIAWRRFKRWVIGPTVALVLLVAVGASITSIVLRVRYPNQYEQWRTSPLGWTFRAVTDRELWDIGL